MSAVLDFNQKLQTITCCNCGMTFAVPPSWRQQRIDDKAWWYCPNGHTQHFTESEIDRLKKEVEQEKRNTEWYKTLARSKDTQIKGLNIQVGKVKAKLHRTERRIANGGCPCCHRTFINMQRHMKTKHPDYVKGASE